ncbi:MAG: TauD/TfdA family dioxygenase [Legionella sp.]|nr:TauD/TfdA family dioxygenase [Legionella sp.]
MKERYSGMTTRFLREDERLFSTMEETLPLVIEPVDNSWDANALQAFLTNNSKAILDDIATYGAVLLRGFTVGSTKEFEQTVLSIQGMRGMSHLFMSEPGRHLVDGLDYVFHTNSKIKTGGTLHLGGFHNENYYSPDVPSYISFFCLSPAKSGGETGLINMGRVYEKLDASLKEQLEKNPFFVSKWPLAVIANRYKISLEDAQKACVEFGLNLEENNHVVMHKPNVFKHPVTGENIIQANLCAELPALNDGILTHFTRHYTGWNWMVHKAAWTFLGYQRLRKYSLMLPELIRHPVRFFRMQKLIKQRISQYNSSPYPRIKSVFKPEDIQKLAALMHESYASFLWKKGDVLLIDNLQIAHAGMPGKTCKKFPRTIRAMLCNPFKISYSKTAPGLQHTENLLDATLGEIMQEISDKSKELSHIS